MQPLTEDQVQLVHEYLELLKSIDEGFEYVLASFADYSKTEGDLILSDIFSAFLQVIPVNKDLTVLFHENEKIEESLQAFSKVVLAAEKLDGIFEKSQEKQEVVQQSLYPAYKKWYETVEPQLASYTLV